MCFRSFVPIDSSPFSFHYTDCFSVRQIGYGGISKASISKWCRELREECQSSPDVKEEYDAMKEILKLREKLEEAKKENLFLKKAAAFFAKEIG